MSRVEKKVNGGIHLPPFVFICNRYKFYNFPSIFCFVCPWTRAFPPNSRASFHHRNRDISLRLSKILQARQISFRKFCICTVKKASPSTPKVIFLFSTIRFDAILKTPQPVYIVDAYFPKQILLRVRYPINRRLGD